MPASPSPPCGLASQTSAAIPAHRTTTPAILQLLTTHHCTILLTELHSTRLALRVHCSRFLRRLESPDRFWCASLMLACACTYLRLLAPSLHRPSCQPAQQIGRASCRERV